MATLKNHPGKWLRDDAAAAFNQAEDEHGTFIVNSAGRTVAEQNEAIKRWDQGGKWNRPPYLYAPARPATASNHVSNGGIAVDIGDWRRFANIAANYGFSHPYPDGDPVHFEYTGQRASSHNPTNPFGISSTLGLQKIARLYGYQGQLDNIWGNGSAAGFAQFLRNNWGYKGNDVLGPVMWQAIQRWLKARWGYSGAIDGIPGPLTKAALQRAETANYLEL